jgi:hypothetical protein
MIRFLLVTTTLLSTSGAAILGRAQGVDYKTIIAIAQSQRGKKSAELDWYKRPCDSQAAALAQTPLSGGGSPPLDRTASAPPQTPISPAADLILFTSPTGCAPCYVVERDCLEDPRVEQALARFNFIRMGTDQASAYGVRQIPTIWYRTRRGAAWTWTCPTDPAQMADLLNTIANSEEAQGRQLGARP